jgi:diguanylate cyclase (GGDEF)-like protein
MIGRGRALAERMQGWLFPPVPRDIARALLAAQAESLTSQVPVLLAIAGLNTAILMAVCAFKGLPFVNYGWMGLLILYTLLRGTYLRRQFARAITPRQQRRLVDTARRAALLVLALLGIVAGTSYATGLFDRSLLIPMSLGFGALSIAHCLYRIRAVGLGAIGLGIGPSALMLIFLGDFEAQMLGVSMLSVGWLMLRFVAAQYDQFIDNLLLQARIYSMAHSDPLTGLANRRAVTEFLDRQPDFATIGVALLDLNDFKQVNDQHGHDVGDALLQIVAERLRSAWRQPGLVGRLGGDEFVVIATGIADVAQLSHIAAGLREALAPPAQIGALCLSVGASIGWAQGQASGDSIDGLMKRADKALYAAKAAKLPTVLASKAA